MAVPTSGINSPHRARRYDPSADEAAASLPAEGPVASSVIPKPSEPLSGPLEDREDLEDADPTEEPENGSEGPLVTGERFPSLRNPSDSS